MVKVTIPQWGDFRKKLVQPLVRESSAENVKIQERICGYCCDVVSQVNKSVCCGFERKNPDTQMTV